MGKNGGTAVAGGAKSANLSRALKPQVARSASGTPSRRARCLLTSELLTQPKTMS